MHYFVWFANHGCSLGFSSEQAVENQLYKGFRKLSLLIEVEYFSLLWAISIIIGCVQV